MRFNLDDLHWQQFEVLTFNCLQELISSSVQFIDGGGDKGRDIIFTGVSNDYHSDWSGKWIIQAKHKSIRGNGEKPALSALLSDLGKELKKVFITNKLKCNNYVLVTNLTISGDFLDKATEIFNEFKVANNIVCENFEIVGYRHLESCIEKYSYIKWKFPNIISHPDFESLFELSFKRIINARNKGWFKAIAQKRNYFVHTEVTSEAISKINSHNIILFSGHPKSGKTFNAEMIALYYFGNESFEVLRIDDPEEIEEFYDFNKKQIFVCDDAFGIHELSYTDAEDWDRKLESIFYLADEKHKFIFTTRENIYRAFKNYAKSFSEEFLGYISVESSKITIGEKEAILDRYIKLSLLNKEIQEIIEQNQISIIEHQNFSPETIRAFFSDLEPNDSEVLTKLLTHLGSPDKYLSNVFFNLSNDKKAAVLSVLCALEKNINEVKKTYNNLCNDLNITKITSTEREFEEIEGAIIKITKTDEIEAIDFYHPSMYEFLMKEFQTEKFGVLRTSILKNLNTILVNQFFIASSKIPKLESAKGIIGIKGNDLENIKIGLERLINNEDVKIHHILRVLRWFFSDDISLGKLLDKSIFLGVKEIAEVICKSIFQEKIYYRLRDESCIRWSDLLLNIRRIESIYGIDNSTFPKQYLKQLLKYKKGKKDFWRIPLSIASFVNDEFIYENVGKDWMSEFFSPLRNQIYELGYEIYENDFPEFNKHNELRKKDSSIKKIKQKPNRTWYPRFLESKAKIELLKRVKKSEVSRKMLDDLIVPYNEILKASEYAKNRHSYNVQQGWWNEN